MNKTIRRNSIVILGLIFLLTLICACVGNFGFAKRVNADASNYIVMEPGASIRVDYENDAENSTTGIRFEGTIKKALSEMILNDAEGDAEVGITIMPKMIFDRYEAQEEYDDLFTFIAAKYGKSKQDVSSVFNKQLLNTNSDSVISGRIVRIIDANYNLTYQAVAYYTLDGTTYVYSNYSEDRSIGYVADYALKNYELEDEEIQPLVSIVKKSLALANNGTLVGNNLSFDLAVSEETSLQTVFAEKCYATDLTYAIKEGSDCVAVDANGTLSVEKEGTAVVTVSAYGGALSFDINVTVENLLPKAKITGNGAFGIALTQDDNGNALVAGDVVKATIKYKTTGMTGGDPALWVYDFAPNAPTANGSTVRLCGNGSTCSFEYTPDESGYVTIPLWVYITEAGITLTSPLAATTPVTGLNFLHRAFANDAVGEVILESVEKIAGKSRITANGAFGVALTQDDNGNKLFAGNTVNITVKYKTSKTAGAFWVYDTSVANNITRLCGTYATIPFAADDNGYMTFTLTTTITVAGTQMTYPDNAKYALPVTGVNFLQRDFSNDTIAEVVIESVEKVIVKQKATITGNGAFGIALSYDDNGNALVAGDVVKATIKYKTTGMTGGDPALWVYDFAPNAPTANGSTVRLCGNGSTCSFEYTPDESGYVTIPLWVYITEAGITLTSPLAATTPVTGLNFLHRAFANDAVGEVILESVEKIAGKSRITANGAFGVALTQDDNGVALNVGDTVTATIKYKVTALSSNDSAFWYYSSTAATRLCGYHATTYKTYEPDETGYMTFTITTAITAAGTKTTSPDDSIYDLPVTGLNFLQRKFANSVIAEVVVESVEKVN